LHLNLKCKTINSFYLFTHPISAKHAGLCVFLINKSDPVVLEIILSLNCENMKTQALKKQKSTKNIALIYWRVSNNWCEYQVPCDCVKNLQS
jgi:hypothetical protein